MELFGIDIEIFISAKKEPSVNIIKLQALPKKDPLGQTQELDPLAVLHLNNWL